MGLHAQPGLIMYNQIAIQPLNITRTRVSFSSIDIVYLTIYRYAGCSCLMLISSRRNIRIITITIKLNNHSDTGNNEQHCTITRLFSNQVRRAFNDNSFLVIIILDIVWFYNMPRCCCLQPMHIIIADEIGVTSGHS